LTLVWTVLIAWLAGLILAWSPSVPVFQLSAMALLIGLQVEGRPRFCNLSRTLEAPSVLARRDEPQQVPMGFEFSPWAQRASGVPWEDYRAVLGYLRNQTAPTTRVANMLRGYPPLTSPTGRLSAFPAESVAWLIMVRPQDESRFARALEATPDSVVVWSTDEVGRRSQFNLFELAATIRRLYRPAARFGKVEVWVRNRDLAPRLAQPSESPTTRSTVSVAITSKPLSENNF
jgi:hypothetical protein